MHRLAVALLLVLVNAPLLPAEAPPVSPEKAPALMTLPEGFHATLFAGEPDLVKPIAMTTDDRGRLWVIESHSYPKWITDGSPGRDRILIFEDRKGTGHFDACTVFWDKGTNLSGIALGFGGVWLCATPNLLFLPVKPGEDHPAGPPEVVLDGWDLKAQHNVFNGITWGPDGWLYGCNGILSNSRIGKPGTPDNQRVAFNCGVWRYHPTRKVFEPYAWGTTNPWGLDFDDEGEMFITNCVIKHLFHVVPGAHFERMYGQDLNPHCYGLMESCADHYHWAGGNWTTSRGGLGAHSDAGGGHAHSGAMVYLGDNWPDSCRNHIFMCNIHGNRVNQDILEHKGSGYVAHHGQDFLMAHDDWFRGVALLYGPDGGVYVSDWHDTGECHNHEVVQPCGRIFKVVYGKPATVNVDLEKLGDEDLVKLQLHKNDWYVRHARRLLQERAAAGKLGAKVVPMLRTMLREQAASPRRLRALWALHAVNALNEPALLEFLKSRDEAVRRWSVRLTAEHAPFSPALLLAFDEMARKGETPSVRLALASALQRLAPAERLPLADELNQKADNTTDVSLQRMIWYGLEPLVPEHGILIIFRGAPPLVAQFTARRLSEEDKTRDDLCQLLGSFHPKKELLRNVLEGMCDALQGRTGLHPPKGWIDTLNRLGNYEDEGIRRSALVLAVRFGDREAVDRLCRMARDPRAATDARLLALQTLVETNAGDVQHLLQDLVTDSNLRGAAIRGLAAHDDARTPALLLRHYNELTESEKADAVATLASRPAFALALLDAVEKREVPRKDLSAFVIRQMLALKDRRVAERVTQVWGSVRPTAGDKTALMSRYLSVVPPDALKKADRAHGRLIFTKTCATCHTLFGEGGKIGPDLTGSQRHNAEYVLTKVLDPSATVAKDYQVTIFTTNKGRTLSGIVKEETDKTVAVQTQNELVRLEKKDIADRQPSTLSMMPEGLLATMSDLEIRDLFAYLAGADQPPLPGK